MIYIHRNWLFLFYVVGHHTVTMSMNLNLRSILVSNKLTSPNFSDWVRNLWIVLWSEKALFVLDEVAPEVAPVDAPNGVLVNYNRYRNAEEVATYLMLASMSPDLQNSMSIWMLRRSWCTCKSCLVHNLDMRGIRPPVSCSSARWVRAHQWDPTCSRWSLWLRK